MSKFEINQLNGFCVIQESLDIGSKLPCYFLNYAKTFQLIYEHQNNLDLLIFVELMWVIRSR